MQRLAGLVFLALVLGGCGGGGGGGDPTPLPVSNGSGGTPQPASPGPVSPTPTTGGSPNTSDVASGPRLVNSQQAGTQRAPHIARLKDGGHVIAWTSANDQSGAIDACWRRHSNSEELLGNEVCASVPANTGFSGGVVDVVALAGGGFVVATRVEDELESSGVQVQRYDAAGNAAGPAQRVNSVTAGYQEFAGAAALQDGGFLVAWTDSPLTPSGITDARQMFVKRYDAAGTPTGPEQQVSPDPDATWLAGLEQASVVALSDDSYVVVWRLLRQDVQGTLYARHYSAAGVAQGPATLISDDHGAFPLVKALRGGGYVIAWASPTVAKTQVFASDGSKIGPEVVLDRSFQTALCDPRSCFQNVMSLTALDDGGYLVGWTNFASSTRTNYARRFDAASTPAGEISRINLPVLWPNSLIQTPTGGFVVTWTDNDANATGIYEQHLDAQAFRAATTP